MPLIKYVKEGYNNGIETESLWSYAIGRIF